MEKEIEYIGHWLYGRIEGTPTMAWEGPIENERFGAELQESRAFWDAPREERFAHRAVFEDGDTFDFFDELREAMVILEEVAQKRLAEVAS